ncbi:hypothetical protein C4226_19590 [Clostridioides difficile]|uniref:hypothetical protein n=1 Tax=Clostridioides difficile TaxID=1496 RepID=UPI001C162873|nr:hypothetical protein [Clostridioides difficile]EGT4968524.1 hypothetical protein [Clostridioides difficile]MCJ0144320.1 hypothetical protein [Clostridioides difficile]MDB0491123.1 hypothetical protein [Clostridioides difficile]MDB0505764.1 hypothetical protein [Clostridioides difficile]MDB3312781.1 hypothetical protein [Clostridioides difficile]
MIEKLSENASLSDLITTFENSTKELKANKDNFTNLLGNPFLESTKFSEFEGKMQNLMNTFKENLKSKGINSGNTESLLSLINKVASIYIPTPIYTASGECIIDSKGKCKRYTISTYGDVYYVRINLNFYPKFVVMYNSGGASEYFTTSYFCSYVPFIASTVESYTTYLLDKSDSNIQVQKGTCILPIVYSKNGSSSFRFYAVG